MRLARQFRHVSISGQIMGSNRFRVLLLAASVFGSPACGSRGKLDSSVVDHCQPGSADCLSQFVGQICNQQGQWATFQCLNNQACQDKVCVAKEPCSVGASQCLNDRVSQVCDQQGQWVIFPCAGDQACRGDACVATENPCSIGAMQCLTDRVSQVCDHRGQWVAYACASDQICQDGTCVAADEPCSIAATRCLTGQIAQTCDANGGWITSACKADEACTAGRCQAVCSPNTHECVDDRTQRICLSDGSSWVTTDCSDGLKCTNGECLGSCEPGSTGCAATKVVRECRSDGSGYIERECRDGMFCEQGLCVQDVDAACTPGQDGLCRDEHTALPCKLDGSGFDVRVCSNDTICDQGYCRGPICAAGETSCAKSDISNLDGVRTCSDDGTGYSVSICRANEECVNNKDTAQHECYVPPCIEQDTICSDPSGTQSSADWLSRCERLSNGKLGWVSYRCDAPGACTVDERGSAQCHADCAPGDVRCSDDQSAIESCGEDGKWSRQSCVQADGVVQSCLIVPTSHEVLCGDPDCSSLQNDPETYQHRGRCSAEKIRKCGDDGRLQLAAICDEGMCLPESDGFGRCRDPSRCDHEEGWRECVTDNDAYRTCKSHHWEFTLCAADQTCTEDAQGHAACGDECVPDTRRCSDAGYQICSATGTWGPSQICDAGECNPMTTRCEVACQPGEIRCVGDVSLASDGTSLGTSAMQMCRTDGSWSEAQICPNTAERVQHCRRSGNGVHLGCVECVGDAVPGGNEENAVDSRCSADGSGLQICTTNNTWPAEILTCDTSEQCVKRRDGTLRGSCANDGCASNSSRRCVGYQTVTTPETISDCCDGDCQSTTGECWHRQRDYDPTCLTTTSCFTGRYDTEGGAVYETCCSGYCRSGQGCLKIKAQPCAAVTSCEVTRLGQATVCCGSCQTDGSCSTGQEAEHPVGEYFNCSTSSVLCWGISSCTWIPGSGVSGAMYADCTPKANGS